MGRDEGRTGAAAQLPRPLLRMDINNKKNISGGILITEPKEDFQVRSATAATQFDFEDTPPLLGQYVDVNDFLLITAVQSGTGITVTVNVRILGLDGLVHPLKFAMQPASAQAVTVARFQLMEGFLLSATAFSSSGFVQNKLCWVELALTRAPFSTSDRYMELWQGYAYTNSGNGYPEATSQRPTDGSGTLQAQFQATPTVGTDPVFTVGASERWRIVSFRGTLTTSAVVANRLVSLVGDDGVNINFESVSNFTHVASTTNTYNASDSMPYVNVPFNLRTQQPLGSQLYITRNGRFRAITQNLDVGDQWSNVALYFQDWMDVP